MRRQKSGFGTLLRNETPHLLSIDRDIHNSVKRLLSPFQNYIERVFFNWDSLHARLNSHYEAWSYKKKKHKKITAYRISV